MLVSPPSEEYLALCGHIRDRGIPQTLTIRRTELLPGAQPEEYELEITPQRAAVVLARHGRKNDQARR